MHLRGEEQTPARRKLEARRLQGACKRRWASPCCGGNSRLCNSVLHNVQQCAPHCAQHCVPDRVRPVAQHCVPHRAQHETARCNPMQYKCKANQGDTRQYKTGNPNTGQHISSANNVSGTTQGLSNNEHHNTQLTKNTTPTECRPHPGSPDHPMGDRTKWQFSAKIGEFYFNP